jgi:hypothetical protein
MKSLFTASMILIMSASAFASLVNMDTAELVDESDLVVVGKVDGIESFYGTDGFIYSRAYVTVDDVVLGDDPTDVVEVVYPGGIVDGVGMATSISPVFDEGMEVVLFLKLDDEGELVLTNYAASKFTVEDGIVVEEGIPLADYVNEITRAIDR